MGGLKAGLLSYAFPRRDTFSDTNGSALLDSSDLLSDWVIVDVLAVLKPIWPTLEGCTEVIPCTIGNKDKDEEDEDEDIDDVRLRDTEEVSDDADELEV